MRRAGAIITSDGRVAVQTAGRRLPRTTPAAEERSDEAALRLVRGLGVTPAAPARVVADVYDAAGGTRYWQFAAATGAGSSALAWSDPAELYGTGDCPQAFVALIASGLVHGWPDEPAQLFAEPKSLARPGGELQRPELMARVPLFSHRRHHVLSERLRWQGGHEMEWIYRQAGGARAVSVVACTPEGQVLLVDQYRPPVGGFTIELPGGAIGRGEDPVAAGRRELLEETGYEAGETEYLGGLWLAPPSTDLAYHVLFARDCRQVATPQNAGAEWTAVRAWLPAAVEAAVADGRIGTMATLAVLFKTRALWSTTTENATSEGDARAH